MDIKDLIIQAFNDEIDNVRNLVIERLKGILEDRQKKNKELSSEKSSDFEKQTPPLKRQSSPKRQKLKKMKKIEEEEAKEPPQPEAILKPDPPKEKHQETKESIEKPEEAPKKFPEAKPVSQKSIPDTKIPVEKPEEPAVIPMKTPSKIENSATGLQSAFEELKSSSKARCCEILDTVISYLANDSSTLIHLSKLKGGNTLKKLMENEKDSDLKCKYGQIIDTLKKMAEDRELLPICKALEDAFYKKNDAELSAAISKFSETVAEKTPSPESSQLKRCVDLLTKVSRDWRNQEIKNKAYHAVTSYKEKPGKSRGQEAGKSHISSRLEDFIPGISSKKA